jgi:hypothetical protein
VPTFFSIAVECRSRRHPEAINLRLPKDKGSNCRAFDWFGRCWDGMGRSSTFVSLKAIPLENKPFRLP